MAKAKHVSPVDVAKAAQKSMDKSRTRLSFLESKIADLKDKHGILKLEEERKQLKQAVAAIAEGAIEEIASDQTALFVD